ncbi:MAG: ATP/GTP-binding protein [Leifsonia sp.]
MASWLKKRNKAQARDDRAKAGAPSSTRAKPSVRRPTPRGWTGRGGGETLVISPAPEWRGTTVQVCGLWPYGVGTGAPMIGVPLGRHLINRGTVCCDPISWFQRANLISNPSAFVLGKPGLGKSTLIRRMATGLAGYGVQPLVLGDLRPDYVDLIKELNGQVITLGRGRGYLNILDPGEASEAAQILRDAAALERKAIEEEEAELNYLRSSDMPDEAGAAQATRERIAQLVGSLPIHAANATRNETLASQVLQDAHGRRLTMVSALLTITRREPPTDREETIIDRALKLLDETHEGIPVLKDLLELIQAAPDELRAVALDRGDKARYQIITENLEASLIGLVSGGRLGELFSQQTTVRMQRDRPVVYDVSSIDDSETDLQAAVLLACWSAGFGTVNVANALADAELEPRRHYFVILDELWRALRAGRGMVDRVDALTRLNRGRGVGMAMISHTMSDLMSLSSEEDRMKAKGFVERSGMVICGGLPSSEMPLLNSAISMSRAEQEMLQGWQDPPAWDPVSGKEADPPGRGKFLIKVGGRPGIPLTVELTDAERHINDTNRLWHAASRTGVVDREIAV